MQYRYVAPLISLRSKWRLTGFSRRFTPKNPVRLHKPFGQLPRWGAKNVLPLNLMAFPRGEGCDTRIPSSKQETHHPCEPIRSPSTVIPTRGSILRLRRGPFGLTGRRLNGQARRLFGVGQTRKSLCGTSVSKGLLVSLL